MKKIIAGAILVSSSAFAMAQDPAGCGVGTAIVFPDANEWHEHVLAVTTNESTSNTVSMTSNLLNCDSANGPLKLSQAFMDNNMDQLAADSAKGQGETLAALAEVMGIEVQHQPTFNRLMQSNFDAIFSVEATSASAHEAMTAAMAESTALKKYLG
ncbi:DUF3015 family protein [Bacterioplanoides sp.]|uniref:DUF3015 family protein n=1 Tax=Bacterioplanoides sp. TaxID=2066072 RepID=UPI003B5A4356